MNNNKTVVFCLCFGCLLGILLAYVVISKMNVKTYTVSFDSDGGTSVQNITVKDGEMVSRPDNPKKDDYTFIGWKLNGEDYNFSSAITSDIKLEAVWEKSSLEISAELLHFNYPHTEYLITVKPGTGTSLEIYTSDSENGTYTLFKDVKVTDFEDEHNLTVSKFKLTFYSDSTVYIKAKAYYVEDEERKYLDSSRPYKLETKKTELGNPIISASYKGKMDDGYKYIITLNEGTGTALAVYTSDTENGEYVFEKNIYNEDVLDSKIYNLTLSTGGVKYIKIKPFITNDGKSFYGEFTNAIKVSENMNTTE